MTYFSSAIPDEQTITFVNRPEDAPTENFVKEKSPASLDVRYDVVFQIGHRVPEVEAIFTQMEGRVLRVWTVVPERNEVVYKKIYAQEKKLLNSLDGIEFEFNIIPNMGRKSIEVVTDPSGALIFER